MNLPPVLIVEAAKIIFTYWEQYAAHEQGITPVPWDRLTPEYQARWLDIVSVVLELGITVVMKDAVEILDESNGDLGGAIAKALKRYMRDRLNIAPPK